MSNMRHALSMSQYGIDMIVYTTQNEIERTIKTFKAMPLRKTRSIHKQATDNARSASNYFDKNPNRLPFEQQKYQDLCDDCLIISISGLVGFKKPVHFIHPNSIKNLKWNPTYDIYRQNFDLTVDYDPSIPTKQ